MAAKPNNLTVSGYKDRIVESDLRILEGNADSDESFGSIRTRLRNQDGTITAQTEVTILVDTATGSAQITELCEDVVAHFNRVKSELASISAS